jgi:long-chain fatty acid transport protein
MQHLHTRYNRWLILLVGVTLTIASIARGGGIEVPMQDAKAAGEADAFTAQADDPSAIFYNPAGLTQIQGTQISVGAYYLQPEFHFQGNNGSNERMGLPSVLPHIYVESDLGTNNWRFGFGVNDVFGINEDWGNTGPLRTLVDQAQLSVINLAPTVAYKINENLSLGLAVNIYYGDLYLQRNVVLAAPPVPEGQFHYRGEGWAVGATPSLMWKINDHNQVGVYYRSPFTLNFSGQARITSVVMPQIAASATTPLELPQSIGAGYSWRPNDKLTAEGDVIWTDWHSLKSLSFQSGSPFFNGQAIPANWLSGFTLRAGLQYRFDRHWSVRGGYAYSQTSVPEETFSPLVPDSNYHLFAVGGGYSADHWALDLACNLIYRERRHIISVSDPIVDGTWDNMMYGLMLTFTAKL